MSFKRTYGVLARPPHALDNPHIVKRYGREKHLGRVGVASLIGEEAPELPVPPQVGVDEDVEVVLDVEHARGDGHGDESQDRQARHGRIREGHVGRQAAVQDTLSWSCGRPDAVSCLSSACLGRPAVVYATVDRTLLAPGQRGQSAGAEGRTSKGLQSNQSKCLMITRALHLQACDQVGAIGGVARPCCRVWRKSCQLVLCAESCHLTLVGWVRSRRRRDGGMMTSITCRAPLCFRRGRALEDDLPGVNSGGRDPGGWGGRALPYLTRRGLAGVGGVWGAGRTSTGGCGRGRGRAESGAVTVLFLQRRERQRMPRACARETQLLLSWPAKHLGQRASGLS